MHGRIIIFAAVGIAFLPASYFGFVSLFERIMIPPVWEPPTYVRDVSGETGKDGFRPVCVFRLGPDTGKRIVNIRVGWGFVTERAVVIVVAHGQAFVGNELVPTDQITSSLDAEEKRGVNYVIVSGTKGTVIKDMMGVVDACRRSSMRAVLLNETRVE